MKGCLSDLEMWIRWNSLTKYVGYHSDYEANIHGSQKIFYVAFMESTDI